MWVLPRFKPCGNSRWVPAVVVPSMSNATFTPTQHKKVQKTICSFELLEYMASNLIAMTSNLLPMASNLIALRKRHVFLLAASAFLPAIPDLPQNVFMHTKWRGTSCAAQCWYTVWSSWSHGSFQDKKKSKRLLLNPKYSSQVGDDEMFIDLECWIGFGGWNNCLTNIVWCFFLP